MTPADAKPSHPVPGDRAPDFWLPNPDGRFARFYDRFPGNPVVLLFCPTAEAPGARSELVVATRDPAETNSSLMRELNLNCSLFSDPKGAITEGYGADRTKYGLLCLVLDSNQRVLAAFADSGGLSRGRWTFCARAPVTAPQGRRRS